MPSKRGKWVAPDQLRRDLEARRQQVEADLRKTSGAPVAMYGSCDPMVEARLADDVVRIVLHHMNREDSRADVQRAERPEATPDRSGARGDADLEQAEIESLFDALNEVSSPPDPLELLDSERLWVLTDLSVHANGIARQRATHELRDAMRKFVNPQLANLDLVERLHAALTSARQKDGLPLILETLHRATARALSVHVSTRKAT